MKKIALLAIVTFSLSGCDDCKKYSDFSCAQIENATYNVHFSLPRGDEIRLGRVSGLKACGAVAYSHAASMGMGRGDNWGYVCCMEAKGSNCYEKHR